MDGKFPCPVPRSVGRVFLCLVHGWSHSLWLWLDAGGPLPTLSWNGLSAPRALLDEQAPVCCALSRHPSWLTQLSSCSWLWHEFPLCFGHLRFSFVVVCLIVGLGLGFFFVFFFWAWSDNFKFYSFYFYVFEVGKGIFHVSSFSSMWGFCCLCKIIAHGCATESSLPMFVLVAIYAMMCLYHDSLSHFPNVEHLEHFQFFINIK